MSNQHLVERETARATTQPQDTSGQRSAATDRSEDHLIRGYD